MKAQVRIFILVHVLTVLAGLAFFWWWWSAPDPLPDEKKAAMELLVEKQSGPRYFESVAAPDEQGIVWIDPAAAHAQIDRVLRERGWGEPQRDKVFKLIARISEPHPSRAVGGDRVNLAKLNLALDSLP